MSALRHIAVHVEEPRRRQFVWVLTERQGEHWQALQRSTSPVHRYQSAMADGLLALQALVADLDLGPRTPQDDSAEPPRAPRAQRPAQPAPPQEAYFGFGPAR